MMDVWNEDNGRYHLYTQNLPAEGYTPDDIGMRYRAQWEVDQIFRELKHGYWFDEFNSSEPVVVETLILIGLLSVVISHILRERFIEIIEAQLWLDSDDGSEFSSLLPWEQWGPSVQAVE